MQYDGAVKVLEPPKDGLHDPRGSLMNEVPSQAIEQANQEFWQLRSTNEGS